MDEIKHFNHNHGKDGRFTFGSGGSKPLQKIASKKLKDTNKEYKGPFKKARKNADKKRNTKIRSARAKIASIKKKMDERSAEHVKKEIREAIIEGNAKKVMKNYRSMTTDELQEAKKRISLINDLNKISKDSDKSFINKLLNTDTKKVGGFLDLANKGMDTYGKYSKFKKELADTNNSNEVQKVIEKYKDVELPDDGYVPKHMKGIKHSDEIKHYNHNHGKDGRFTFGNVPLTTYTDINGITSYKVPYDTKYQGLSKIKIPFLDKHIGKGKESYAIIRKDLLKDDLNIKKGSKIYRMSSTKEKPGNTPAYVTINERDKNRYIIFMRALSGEKGVSKYLHTFTAKKNIKIPSYYKQINTFSELMKDDTFRRNYLKLVTLLPNYEGNKSINNIIKSINNPNYEEQKLTKTYNDFYLHILQPADKHVEKTDNAYNFIRNKYKEALMEQGYDGYLDNMDIHMVSESPIYLFNTKETLNDNPKIIDATKIYKKLYNSPDAYDQVKSRIIEE